MNSADKNKIYHSLRQKFPIFIYEKYNLEITETGFSARFHFNLSGKYHFNPEIFIPRKKFINFEINESELNNLVFQIGMIELISYWKAACSPEVIIEAGSLNQEQVEWWKKLYYNGLGEFFYRNGIHARKDDFMSLSTNGKNTFQKFEFDQSDSFLVPVGGGKDSVVTLETLVGGRKDVRPFILNPGKAGIDTVGNVGFSEEDILTVDRTIDPVLLKLNAQGFLNGHTPFSALLAFISLLAARLAGIKNIALSNESSANEPTVPGTEVNHQYSKSFEFERGFRDYVAKYISGDFNYFSFLRPLSELQIAKAFSKFPAHFSTFRSCNVGSKSGSWCGECPKCLFSQIILSPYISQEKLVDIFGKDLFADDGLLGVFEELIGESKTKPFECVGTIDEVNHALVKTIEKVENPLPFLLDHYKNLPQYKFYSERKTIANFSQLNNEHFVSGDLLKVIREGIE